jgi:type I restriction enzyme S subunit
VEANENLTIEIDRLIMAEYRKLSEQLNGFSIVKAENLFDISIGRTPPRKESKWFSENTNDIKWLSISDLGQSFYFAHNTNEYLTAEAVLKFNVKVIPTDTVILSFKLTVGRVAITASPMTSNEAIAHFCTKDELLKEYLYCYLRNYNFDLLGNTSSIATAVNSKTIKNMGIPLPNKEKLVAFHNSAYPLFALIKQKQIENQRMTGLKQLYLKKFFS